MSSKKASESFLYSATWMSLCSGAEMQRARPRDRDLRHHVGVGGDELEMLEHRVVVGEAELAGDGGDLRLGLDAVELDAAAFPLDHVEAVEHAHEIEMPPCAAELAVGHGLQARHPPACGWHRGSRRPRPPSAVRQRWISLQRTCVVRPSMRAGAAGCRHGRRGRADAASRWMRMPRAVLKPFLSSELVIFLNGRQAATEASVLQFASAANHWQPCGASDSEPAIAIPARARANVGITRTIGKHLIPVELLNSTVEDEPGRCRNSNVKFVPLAPCSGIGYDGPEAGSIVYS